MAYDETWHSQTLAGLDRQQLEIYAKELQEHYREQRRLRRELEGLNQVLEQRVRELQALNKLFQQHLVERSATAEAYRDLLAGLESVTQAGNALVERARSYPVLDLNVVASI